ncbi:hypothetical protein R5W23_001513 [Gemmata sp. JC673]|uniref:PIN domain-containing protein n=1 Tax=Gemmata algarum TaxID=2975278 RepID=A0ABU5EZA1_9BACT|nr:hypothetical protein [Gemmata algarum]MDY3560284.1 hypothetical protein [Gemmata algarum]
MIFPTSAPASAPPAFVLHTSVAADWGIPARYTVYSHRVRFRLAAGTAAVVATSWPLELAEELLAAVRRNDTNWLRTDGVFVALPAYRIYLDERAPHLAWPEVLDLARTYGLPVHEAASLELAVRTALPLATTSPALLSAAASAAVPVFTP